MTRLLTTAAAVALLLLPVVSFSEEKKPVPVVPGPQPGGAVLLPNQWLLKPTGRQVTVGDFPVNIALHPDGKFAAVLHCGHGDHEIVMLDLAKRTVASRVNINEAFYGLAWSPDGSRLFCSGSGDEVLHAFRFEKGSLVPLDDIPLRDAKIRGIPSGLAVSGNGRTIFTANVWGHTITRMQQDGETWKADELTLKTEAPAPAPERPATTDERSITKRADQLLEKADGDPFPYACLLDEKGGRLFISLWGQAAVAVVDLKEWKVTARWAVEEHPNEMLLSRDGKRLFVANANRNSVSVLDTASGKITETLVATLQADAPPGNTPNSLAFARDEELLLVANANINTVAVFEIEEPGKARSLGFIPVGWYPTSVRAIADGKTLLVANGKGLISDSNRNGPRPGSKGSVPGIEEYIGGLFDGTVSFIDLPAGMEALEKKLADWTLQAFSCVPKPAGEIAADNPIPRKAGGPTPIKYVIYVVKENRTYDQILGDMKEGNGDPTLCLFPENVTPNHHALAREFVLLDNFYVESEVSADGHEWSMGAYATDFVEKNWPMSYGHDKRGKFPYPSEGGVDSIARPAGGYLWDRAKEAGVTYRSYGEWVANGKTPDDPAKAKVASLVGHIDEKFRGFDMAYPDVKRAERFISELKRFEAEGEMPRLQIVRLPNDHTSGASVGRPTPTAHVAENDLAFGMMVEAVTKSKFWPQTAIFVVEDDAQNGSDHVDAHRTIAYAISPFTRRGAVDSTMYSTSSMLRTMELILGLKPMSQFDAAALPMFASFHAKADLTPYTARPAQVNLEEKNTRTAWGADASSKMNFAKEDAADDLLLNEIIWRSVRGAESKMPAPRRAAFVFSPAEDEDDD